MIGLLGLLALQLVVPSSEGRTIEQRITILAEQGARALTRIENSIFADPDMRSEIRRVGFVRGCNAVTETSRAVLARHHERIVEVVRAAIDEVIPESSLAQAQVLSLTVGSLAIYDRRVDSAVERIGVAELEAAREDMRSSFLTVTAALQDADDPNANSITPRADIARALSVSGDWDMDDQHHLAMACSEYRIPEAMRPTISGDGPISEETY
ncbi:MAG: hypothetical protein ACTS1X_05635 [Parasphingopyxis sp.]|uniref:hypothetical protein n=1 Tax=Parasphingopyxis sp. TaxID=1920299 RepID=UPI003F9F10B4